jgi:hypothetical protein
MLRQGKSIEYVSQQLGHSKIDITIAPRPHQWVASAVEASENLVPPG